MDTKEVVERYSEIYLVDDFEMVNFLHNMLLKKLGFSDGVNTFTDPQEALEDLRSKKGRTEPILVLLDINMPEMSGFEFLEYLVGENLALNIDVVVVTSSISDNDRTRALEYPQFVKEFVIKPLNIRRLSAILEPMDKAV